MGSRLLVRAIVRGSAHLISYSGPFRKNMIMAKGKKGSRGKEIAVHQLGAVRHNKTGLISLARPRQTYEMGLIS